MAYETLGLMDLLISLIYSYYTINIHQDITLMNVYSLIYKVCMTIIFQIKNKVLKVFFLQIL